MANYSIITDSSCDLSKELMQELGVTYTPLYYTMGGETLANIYGEGQSLPAFYEAMRAGEVATTSAANPDSWTAMMEPILARGEDVLVLAFSSGLSATCAAAQLAAADMREKYPDRTVYVVDSLGASAGEGLMLYHAAQRKKEGQTIQQVYQWLEDNKLHLAHWFTVDDLQYLKRGGRVSGATALIATVLNIKPVMHMDDEGHLVSVNTVRGRKKSLQALVQNMKETILPGENPVVFISHGDCLDDAQYVADQVRSELGIQDVRLFYVGPVIGAHSGPGTVALFFLAEHR